MDVGFGWWWWYINQPLSRLTLPILMVQSKWFLGPNHKSKNVPFFRRKHFLTEEKGFPPKWHANLPLFLFDSVCGFGGCDFGDGMILSVGYWPSTLPHGPNGPKGADDGAKMGKEGWMGCGQRDIHWGREGIKPSNVTSRINPSFPSLPLHSCASTTTTNPPMAFEWWFDAPLPPSKPIPLLSPYF
jgi:hypothetical protein